jgi:hypothetical protein
MIGRIVIVLLLQSTFASTSAFSEDVLDVFLRGKSPKIVFSNDVCNDCLCCISNDEFQKTDLFGLLIESARRNNMVLGSLHAPTIISEKTLRYFADNRQSINSSAVAGAIFELSRSKILDVCEENPNCVIYEDRIEINSTKNRSGASDFSGWKILSGQ